MGTFVNKYAEERGLKIVDAKEPLTIEVLPNDVNKRGKKDQRHCAFACAAKRQLKTDEAFVFKTSAYVRSGDTLVRYNLPPSVTREIVAYDRSGEMEPGIYQFSKVNKSDLRKNFKKYYSKKDRTGRRDGKGKTIRHRTTNVRSMNLPK